jgi:hypothetical protein
MGYYQGDFYRGYRGDPGFFGFLGGLAKSAVGLIPGIGPGLSSMLTRAPKVAAPAAAGLVSAGGMSMIKRGAAAVGGAIVKHPVLSAAGAAGAIGAASGAVAGRMGMVPHGQKGMHISKKTGNMVRNRHMNVCNPRALRRAVRRAHGFSKLAMRTIHLIHPKKKVRFGGFKKRKRAA